jgi:hypothetical protein
MSVAAEGGTTDFSNGSLTCVKSFIAIVDRRGRARIASRIRRCIYSWKKWQSTVRSPKNDERDLMTESTIAACWSLLSFECA